MGEMISNEESITSMQGGMRVCACVRADKERARSLSTQFCGYERVCVYVRARALAFYRGCAAVRSCTRLPRSP